MSSPVVTNTSTQLNGASLVYGFATALTDAQLKALPTTPVSCVSAPGAGYRIKVIGATMHLDSAAGAYTNITTSYCALALTYTDAASGIFLAQGPVNDSSLAVPLTGMTTAFGSAASIVLDLLAPYSFIVDGGAQSGSRNAWAQCWPNNAVASEENLAVYVSVDNNGGGVFTGGNAGNSAKVWVYYAVEAVI